VTLLIAGPHIFSCYECTAVSVDMLIAQQSARLQEVQSRTTTAAATEHQDSSQQYGQYCYWGFPSDEGGENNCTSARTYFVRGWETIQRRLHAAAAVQQL
jgi:hypothetical protein